jgi:predicted RNA-binding Zn ribbon-like protein
MTTTKTAGPWLLPTEPVPVRLMNTIWADRRGVHDALATRADLSAWLEAVAPRADSGAWRTTRADLDRARALRDALRTLAGVVCGDHRPGAPPRFDPAAALAAVNAAAANGSPPALAWRDDHLERAAAARAQQVPAAALADVAVAAIELLTDPAAPAIRACNAPGCVLYFVKDHPRREWCSTSCGNRVRAARHYRRHRGDAG